MVVDDHAALRRSVARVLALRECRVIEASSVQEALDTLDGVKVDLIILDIRLGDRSGVEVARRAARLRPAPEVVVLSGEAEPAEAFELGQLGVTEYIRKPGFTERIGAILSGAGKAPPLEPMVKRLVGEKSVGDVSAEVRNIMFDEALARTSGNESRAAEILGVTRQAVNKREQSRRERARALDES